MFKLQLSRELVHGINHNGIGKRSGYQCLPLNILGITFMDMDGNHD